MNFFPQSLKKLFTLKVKADDQKITVFKEILWHVARRGLIFAKRNHLPLGLKVIGANQHESHFLLGIYWIISITRKFAKWCRFIKPWRIVSPVKRHHRQSQRRQDARQALGKAMNAIILSAFLKSLAFYAPSQSRSQNVLNH